VSEEKKAPTLRRKLFLAGRQVEEVAKNGVNRSGKYRYAKADDVLAEAERVLDKYGILIVPSVPSVELRFIKGGGAIAKAEMEFEVTDTKTGESFTKPWAGTGFDKPGDKAAFAAQTGARKYFVAALLTIPIGTDPEEDTAPADEEPSDADLARERQDEAAEAPDVTQTIKPLPKSDLPEADWEGLARGDEGLCAPVEEPAHV
jgi:hypothetical protein